MAALVMTEANVIPVAGFGAETAYLAGATITKGQSIYLDTAASPQSWKLADANAGTALAAGSGGIAISLSTAVAGQPVTAMQSGNLGVGAILTVGIIYCVGNTAGEIVPSADLSTSRNTILGVADTTSNLVMRPWATGSIKV